MDKKARADSGIGLALTKTLKPSGHCTMSMYYGYSGRLVEIMCPG
jgi:hypothetical protein